MKIPKLLIIALFAILSSMSVCKPEWLTGSEFVKSVFKDQLLNISALMVTITTASAAQLHLALNEIDRTLQKNSFVKTRHEIKENVAGIVVIFVIDLLAIVIYNWFDSANARSFILSISICGLLLSTLLMYDIVATIFKVPAHTKSEVPPREAPRP